MKNKIKLKATGKGIKITAKSATLSQIKNAFDLFIMQPKKSKTYTLKK